MKRIIKVFSIIFLMVIFISNIKAEDYKTGDLIKYKDIKFYVMEDNGDYLTLLKATPLTVDEVNKYGTVNGINYVNRYTEKSKGKASNIMGFGYGGVAYYSSEKCYNHYRDHIECPKNYDESDIKYVVDNWSENVLDQNDLKEVNISNYGNYKVRLITKEEVMDKFGIIDDGSFFLKNSLTTPKWLYYYDYWSMTADIKNYWGYYDIYGFIGDQVSYFHSRSPWDISDYPYSYDGGYEIGVRPVIHLNKTADIIKVKNNKKNINDTDFKIGDIIEYNGKEFYVIKDVSEEDDKLTMVTKLPLSYEELKSINNDNHEIKEEKIILDDNSEYSIGKIQYYLNDDKCNNSCESGRCDNVGCTTDYNKSFIKPVVNKWTKDFFKEKLIDENDYEAKILTIDDLKDNLGYIGRSVVSPLPGTSAEYYKLSEESPIFLSNCVTMTQVLESNQIVYNIDFDGNVYAAYVSDYFGVCPVITIKKQLLVDEKVEENIKDKDKDKDAEDEPHKSFIEKVFVPNTLLKSPIFIIIVGIILIVSSIITVSFVIKNKRK